MLVFLLYCYCYLGKLTIILWLSSRIWKEPREWTTILIRQIWGPAFFPTKGKFFILGWQSWEQLEWLRKGVLYRNRLPSGTLVMSRAHKEGSTLPLHANQIRLPKRKEAPCYKCNHEGCGCGLLQGSSQLGDRGKATSGSTPTNHLLSRSSALTCSILIQPKDYGEN